MTISKRNEFKDPVCGIAVDPSTNPLISLHNGKIFYFCDSACLGKFEKKPFRYTNAAQKNKKGWWARYLDRVTKATGGKPPCCH